MLKSQNISKPGNGCKKRRNFAKGRKCSRAIYNLKLFFIILLRIVISLAIVGIITGLIALFSMRAYILSLDDGNITLDLSTSRLALTSFVYVNDENGDPQEYQRAFSSENRVWVDFGDIPQHMKDAIIAIEDKRFYDHSGIDWIRTFSAVMSLLKGSQSHGGSTLTQQLIKNITDDNEISLTRKLREIFRSIHFEEKYSKDEILEAYLNIVNFGAGSRGVQAAANVYFNKNIQDCSIAQCAAIAGITQNPTAYNPFYYPEKNKMRRDTVIEEMFEQSKITDEEYRQALEESENMTFANYSESQQNNNSIVNPVRNWYIEAMFRDIVSDLCEKYRIGKSAAENILLTSGLKIYCAMDQKTQSMVESTVKNASIMPKDSNIELGYIIIDLNGRILATIGCREEKTGNLWYDRANYAKRQPGSTIKPISVYAPAIDCGLYNYSSLILDEPLKLDLDGSGELKNWPNNWYKGYKGRVILKWAIEKSANAPAAQVLSAISPNTSYRFLTEKLGFTSLDYSDSSSFSALAAGGTHVGVTVREMTAAFQIFGNGGNYYKPYSYFYVTDRYDNVILDNRNNIPCSAINSQTASIMNRLLRNVIVGPEGTGRGANIDSWNIVGKTGTTNNDYDSWFIGLSPYAVAGIWIGYDNPKRIMETYAASRIWRYIMNEFLKGKPEKDYSYDPNVTQARYCTQTGKLAMPHCQHTDIGYYANNNMPANCSLHKVTPIIVPTPAPTNEDDTPNEEVQSDPGNTNPEQVTETAVAEESETPPQQEAG